MNQILDYGFGNNDNGGKPKKNANSGGGNFNGSSNGGGKLPMSDKIIKVFAALMVLLAIGLIASGIISILKNKDDSDKQKNNTTQQTKVEAEIEAELNEVSGKVTITVDSQYTISKIIYSWDKEHETILSGEKQTHFETDVVAPQGEHVLHVQVTDEKNNKTMKDFTFDSPIGIDTIKPKVVLTVTDEKKLLVTVTDDTSVAYVTYTWSDSEGNTSDTVTMTPEEEGMTEYEFELDIPRGENTITVIAVDGSDSGNATTASKVLEGVTKPEFTPYLSADSSLLQITCTHEVGIKSLEYTLNGQRYTWEVPEGEVWPELSFDIQSEEGHNVLSLSITSVDDAVNDWVAEWDYNNPEATAQDGENEGSATDEETVGQSSDEPVEDEILGSDETEENN